ncbi:hypothetical protein SAMN05421805_10644 [Saccharopolyspora antimicrobica]|uniref:MinD-like ATPase involved in chromosome partitioning or flagellar assembly n=1 Tax=Saccharopolyspora antimicrobica TaxID=455193 RepID=A0A1I5AXS2_9PSEU|nr:hypothetical protein [Saccharopolyspora antimicrobica]RKT86403.1 hypothetical protein ATL45_4770 [Saccharopolyspora antimicrobica]SFN67316.1 hypothetical protein SAMN05421805_10644 [Saccharopolyspora antimicrobica]
MAVITMVSAKCSPGISTAVAALATVWPHQVLVVDADPAGGDLLTGWGGAWLVDGRLSAGRGLVSFVTSTRHLDAVPSEGLAGHVQELPGLEHVRLLAGVASRAQVTAIGDSGWRRLASAIRDLSGEGPDVLIDVGRWAPETPWSLLDDADLVLVGLRPSLRHLSAARALISAVQARVPITRLGLLVTATTSHDADRMSHATGIPVGVELPDDPTAARFFSDGTGNHPSRRSALLRTSRKAALRLHRSLTRPTPPSTPVESASVGEVRAA